MTRTSTKTTMVVAASALVALALTGPGCGTDTEEPGPAGGTEVCSDEQRVSNPQVAPADLEAAVEGNATFAWDVYAQARQKPGNLFYSPHSISMAMAMIHAGARGTTEQEIASVMSYTLPQDRLHPAFNKLDLELESRGQGAEGQDGEGFRLNVVNAIWGQQDYDFQAPFLDTLAQSYGAGLRVLDFIGQTENSRVTINEWVEDKTEGRIKDLLAEGSITPLTRLVLTNAIYFNAAWSVPFEEELTRDEAFHLADGGTKQVPMMHGGLEARHARAEGMDVVELPYDGEELAMVLLVPDQGQLEQAEATLDAGAVEQLLSGLQSVQLELAMPRFEVDKELKIKKILEDLGLQAPLTPELADFSGITGNRELYIQDVVHKAFVLVDEAGTEAAAATAIVAGATSAPPPEKVVVTVDRPFVFFIHDRATGAILFVGRIMDPAA